MVIYEVSTEIKPSESIIIPETISLPQLRYAAPAGTLAKGDTIEGTVTLKDKDGNVKPLEFDGFKVTMSDWPDALDEEILAVLYMNFVVSKKPTNAPIVPPIV